MRAYYINMIIITTAQVQSIAQPKAFFDRWADMATWPEWNTDTEWVRLDGPFIQGATGQLKPKGGPRVNFVIEKLVADKEFLDVSRLLGARLSFRHEVSRSDGKTNVEVTVSMDGPLAWFWNLILGNGFRATAQQDLDNLVTAVERKE